MKKLSLISYCIIALVAFATWAPNVQAYQYYSDAINDTGMCATCHQGFRETGNYNSPKEGFWGTSLHNAHLNNTTVGSSCDNCHGGAGTSGRQVDLSRSGVAADGTGYHCPTEKAAVDQRKNT